jgi:hypothetical protein
VRILDPHDVTVAKLVDQLSREPSFLALVEHFTTRVIPQLTKELVCTPGGDSRDWASGRIAALIEITDAIRLYRESVKSPAKPIPGAKPWQ